RIRQKGAADRIERVITAANQAERSGRPHRAIPGSTACGAAGRGLRPLHEEVPIEQHRLILTESGTESGKELKHKNRLTYAASLWYHAPVCRFLDQGHSDLFPDAGEFYIRRHML
ncbi:MAG: hypothetical protein IKI42_09045, partial [Clostridia bacterium]|nr:hypothetical protein [Clostridia bacterium]